MNHRKLVQPEHMNDQGSLFGGYLLKWIDEFAYITACIDYTGNRFVTIGLDQVEFKHPIALGEILRFTVTETRKGTTSVSYLVEVFGEREAPSASTIGIWYFSVTGAMAFVRPEEYGPSIY